MFNNLASASWIIQPNAATCTAICQAHITMETTDIKEHQQHTPEVA
jgi:hypothetical protein